MDDTQEQLDDTYVETLKNVPVLLFMQEQKIWYLKLPSSKMTDSTTMINRNKRLCAKLGQVLVGCTSISRHGLKRKFLK